MTTSDNEWRVTENDNEWYNEWLREFQHKCFPVNIAKFLRTFILKNICELLLLHLLLIKKKDTFAAAKTFIKQALKIDECSSCF